MILRLLAIVPPEGSVDPALVGVWLAAGASAATLAVVLREPGAAPQALLAEDHRLSPLRLAAERAGIACLLACDEAGLETGSKAVRSGLIAGLHLRGDPSVACLERARSLIGPDKTLGRACHGAPAPGDAFVDYSCIAPVFAPRTHHAGPPKTPAGLELVAAWGALPSAHPVALGGITGATAAACVQAGAAGLASIRGFFGHSAAVAEDVAGFVEALRTCGDDT